jgi:acetyl esterase
MERCWSLYLDGADGTAPDASPVNADDLSGVAPAYLAVAGHDVLRDDGLRYAEALRAAGVDVTLERYDDMVHGFLRWGGVVERARELIEALGEYTRAVIGRDRDAS